MNENLNPQIRLFLESLLTERGIKVPADLREQMLSDLNDRLQVRFQQIITEQLSAADLKALDQTAPKGEATVQDFLRSKISNLDQLLIQAMAEFRQAFLQG